MKTVFPFVYFLGGISWLEKKKKPTTSMPFFCLFSERHKSFWLTRVDMIQEPKEKKEE